MYWRRDRIYAEEDTMEATRTNPSFYQHLTPENSVVMFIDFQTGIMPGVKTIDPVVLRNNVVALSKVALLYDLPVILTTTGSKGQNGPIMLELTAMFPDHHAIDRTHIDAMGDPRILDAIRKTGRRKLIISGISTDVSLAFAAISAVRSGYNAYAVLDTSGTWSQQIEMGAVARMVQAGVIPTNWAAVTAELQSDWTRETRAEVASIFEESMSQYRYAIRSFLATGSQAPPPAESRR
jgi:nicotinamidase-related amidase